MRDEYICKMLSLAKRLQVYLKNFYLTGGTALMFRYNHRISTYLDFMTHYAFSFNRIVSKLKRAFDIEKTEFFEDNVDLWIEGIKVSIIYFPFKNIEKTVDFKGIKMSQDYDIFLNKIYAARRRIDIKDPRDAAFLYEKYRWDNNRIKADFMKKFEGQSYELYLGALLSFDDYPELSQKEKNILLNLLEEK